MQENPALFCMRDDCTTTRFVIYDSWVAFDVTTLLTSAPNLLGFLLLTTLHHYSDAPTRGFEPNRKCNFALLMA